MEDLRGIYWVIVLRFMKPTAISSHGPLLMVGGRDVVILSVNIRL